MLVGFPARLVLAGSVLGVFAASSGTVYSLSEDVGDASVTVYDASSDQAPAEPAPPVPTVTGAQLAALAVGPARERAAALIAEREAAERASREAEDDDDGDRSPEERIRAALQDACDDGRIRGVICRNI